MNKILNRKININITKIIGEYLLTSKQKINILQLEKYIDFINYRLDSHLIFHEKGNICIKNFNDCQIFNMKNYKLWSIKFKEDSEYY